MGSTGSISFYHCYIGNFLLFSFRYPRSEPIDMTRLVSEHDQPHILSPFSKAAPISRLRRVRLRRM
jgi:hypothetical protein